MTRRLGFFLSILAACGIHAVVLLVPRTAIAENVPIPTVELDLSAAPAFEKATPAVIRRIAPAVATTTRPVAPREAPPPSAPLEPAAAAPTFEQPLLPESPGPATASGSQEAQVARVGTNLDAPAASDPSPVGGAGGTASGAGGAASGAGGAASGAGGTASGAADSVSVPVPPRPRAEILPTYPRSARRSGLEGVVKVTVMVDVSGAVTSAEVLASSGHASLDQAALEAVRRALFAPALQEGKPVPCRIVIPIRFQLSAAARD